MEALGTLLGASWRHLGRLLGGFWSHMQAIWSYLGAWRVYFKRLVEFLKNHQKPCKVLQKSRFGGLNIEPTSPKIALRSSLGVTFVEQDRPRASKNVPRASQAAKKTRRRRPRSAKMAQRGLSGKSTRSLRAVHGVPGGMRGAGGGGGEVNLPAGSTCRGHAYI